MYFSQDATTYCKDSCQIQAAIIAFENSSSLLAFALKENTNSKKLLETEKIHSSGQFVFGKLPHLADINQHWQDVNQDLKYFFEVCEVIPSAEFAEACLFWRLKTGVSLAEKSADIITRNFAYHDSAWFSKGAKYKTSIGKVISVLALPAFGKNHFSESLRQSGDFRLLDPDIFRFNTIAKDVLEIDKVLFDKIDNGEYLKTQHIYGPLVRNVFRLLYLSTALPLQRNGNDIIANGFVFADLEESDFLIWIESSELTLERFKNMKFPSYDIVETLAKTSKDEETFLQRIDSLDLLEAINIVKAKVDKKNAQSTGSFGDFPWDNIPYQPIIDLQSSGANPPMNLVDITLKIVGIQQTIFQLESSGSELFAISSENIPSPDRIRDIVNSHTEVLSITERESSILPPLSPREVITPSELYQLRQKAISDSHSVIHNIIALIDTELIKLESPYGNGRTKAIKDVVHYKCLQVLNGIRTGGKKDSVQKTILSEVASSNSSEILNLLSLVLELSLTISESDPENKKFNWITRWEPQLDSAIPAPIHSLIVLPYLGINILDHRYDINRYIADIFHDILEEATYCPEENGVIQKGRLYSLNDETREDLLNFIFGYNSFGPKAAFSAEILSDAFTQNEQKNIHLAADRFRSKEHLEKYLKSMNGISLGDFMDRNTQFFGPIRDTLLDIQKQIALERMLLLRETSLEDIDSEIIANFSCARRDKIEATLTIDRYLSSQYTSMNPAQARMKVIAYSARLLASNVAAMETYTKLPDELKVILNSEVRTFIPSLFWAIDELVNPKLIESGQLPITDLEIYRFYWDYYAPYVDDLKSALTPFANNRVDTAFNRRGWQLVGKKFH
jgi:hypothetical protein